MPRPNLLLLPNLTELEWMIRPLLEEWAEVASFDAPGIGAEPATSEPWPETIVARAQDELERRGWDRFVIVGDEFAAIPAAELTSQCSAGVAGLALGHAALVTRLTGERPTVNPDVVDVGLQMMNADYRAFVHEAIAVWDPRRTGGSGPEDRIALVDEYLERVSADVAVPFYEQAIAASDRSIETILDRLDAPVLLAEHDECTLYTPEGFAEIVAAFPEADTVSCPVKPSMSPEFAGALHELCERSESLREGAAGPG